jgi:hypothetical protein
MQLADRRRAIGKILTKKASARLAFATARAGWK